MENGGVPRKPGKGESGNIEKIYQKKSQLEHILLRPDTYIGTVEHTKELMWVYDSTENRMIQKEINFVPGLYKIFDEILVNAADNKQRDPKMTCIRIDIDPEKNVISVWNNGKGIPVVMHKDEKMYVPTMIFGHLLTSSNYNDEEEKVTGGRNGYGAKLCNIFSTSFTVESAAREYKRCFRQTWGSNMTKASEPRIKDFHGEDFTKVTFSPDLSKFKMERLDEDIVALMSRRAYDVAASTRGVSVYLNGTKLPIKNFKDYIDLYLKNNTDDAGNAYKLVYEICSERWEVAVAQSDKGFQQVSFVNSIATTKGGRHVDHVIDNVVKQLIDVLKKKNKGGINIKPFQVRNHIWVFINCLIVNPTFDSQTKENMTLQAKNFGSKCILSEKFIAGVSKSGIVESVLSWAKFKAQTDLAKTSGKKNTRIKGVPKLEDANEAGTKNSHLCTLILTEGDSAKSLAVSGLGVIGRNHYGVFPLRGKLLNVREATHKQILENAEINNLIKIIGLQYKKKYLTLDDLKTLRYGKVMIMTDQDQDGSHIKGLLINFIHTNWPELLRLPFLEEFITPIVKAKKGNIELSFYSLPEYEEWRNDTPDSKNYKIKYYKGLGTSTSNEAKEYFQNMDKHRILFKHDGNQDDESIVMAFSKKAIEQRKEWLTTHMDDCKRRKLLGLPDKYLYQKNTKYVSYNEFVNLELVLFSNADNVRSIPSLVDGFKPGQRKVLYTCFKRNLRKEVKVAQFAGSVAEISGYHHGEQSLCMTIVSLAQNFVGSNNINLLLPNGQFGTRLAGGKDSASPRYIFTLMSPLARLIFHEDDDKLMEAQYEDNMPIEPVWYCPIIPMVLVNGAEGIGTGWSTKIPNHNPRDLIKNIRLLLSGEETQVMHPWYKNFRGTIEYIAEHKYLTNGNISIIGDNKVEITELPIGAWTQTYKENVLEPLLHGNDKIKSIISDYKEYHTDTTVRFVVSFAAGEFDRIYAEDGGFHRVFKLSNTLSLTQMHCFDSIGCLKRYNSSDDILKEFYALRLEFYQKRRDYLVGKLEAEADKLSEKARFILEKCEKTLVVENKKRKIMIDELVKRGYKPDPVKEWTKRVKLEEEAEQGKGDSDDEEEVTSDKIKKEKKPEDADKAFQKSDDFAKYDYLLGMPMWFLTEERKNELLKQRDKKLSELSVLKSKTSETLWLDDLDAFEMKLNEVEEEERNEELGITKKMTKAIAAKAKAGMGKRRTIVGGDDIHPSANGIKVEFKVTKDILLKFEKAAALAKKDKTIKKEKVDGEPELDDFDALVKSKEPTVKKEPVEKEKKKRAPKTKAVADGLKQSKLNFDKPPKKRGGGRKKKGSGSDDQSAGSDDDEFCTRSNISQVERERPGRRAASKKINYSALLGDDDENDSASDGNIELFDNTAIVERGPTVEKISDEEYQSDHSAVVVSESETSPVKKRGGPKPKSKQNGGDKPVAKRSRKKKSYTDSSDDEKPAKKSKTKITISDSDDDDDVVDDDDDDSDFM